MYFGKVVNINDNLKLGRVKVKVYDLHDNIKTVDLPWSQVMMPGNTPAISGQGHSVNLAVGSLVCGIFLDIAQQEFMVMGSLPTKTDAAFDNNDRVRSINPHVDDPKGDYEPDSAFAPEYPYNNVYETGSGHAKEYDDTPGYERIMERHKSGTQYEIQPDGTKIERIVRDNYQLVVGHDTLEVYGNVRIIISGQADIAVANDVNLAVGGNLAADITGTSNLTSTGDITIKSDNIKLDGDVVVTGTTKTSDGSITLDTHEHLGDGGDNESGNTGPPITN